MPARLGAEADDPAARVTMPAGRRRGPPGRGSAPRRRRAGRLLLILVPLLGACVSEDREQELGDSIAAEVNSQLPLIRDPLLYAYINQLGKQIASVSDRPDMRYSFYIINSAEVNAFALPGGHIYLTRGLLARTENGDELAGVLAHEVGHVAARHGIQKLERHLRTGSLVSVMYRVILGGEPGLLRRNALHLGGVLWSAAHSRQDEDEADRLAVRYLLRANVDPGGMVSLLEGLVEDELDDTRRVAEWFSTHPLTQNRVEHVRELIVEKRDRTETLADLRIAGYSQFLRRLAALPPPPEMHGF